MPLALALALGCLTGSWLPGSWLTGSWLFLVIWLALSWLAAWLPSEVAVAAASGCHVAVAAAS